jgi:16S rRNA (guanine966-N2)-methyltransferase
MRIIAGRFRGRVLTAPGGRETRPTSALARGALFEILRGQLQGAYVADLFAGTGALGLEALSRGALRVDFYESQRRPLTALRKNIDTLGVGAETRIVSGRLPEALGLGEPYDVVLIDPPWRQGHELEVASRIMARGRLAAGGLMVIEAPRDDTLAEARYGEMGYVLDDRRRYGDTELRFFSRAETPPLEGLAAELEA